MSSPREPRIVAFLAAETLSAVGSWATMIAIWGYAAFEFDASASEVAIFGLAFGIPGMVLGPVAGAAGGTGGSADAVAGREPLVACSPLPSRTMRYGCQDVV